MTRGQVGRAAVLCSVVIALAVCVAIWSRRQTIVYGRAVPPRQRQPLDAIDHSIWNRLLARHVDERGGVDYAGWKRSKPDLAALDDYLAELSRGDPAQRSRGDGRMAFWINAYNAVVVRGLLESDSPVLEGRSQRDWWKPGPLVAIRLLVGDAKYSLSAIEQELHALDDPRYLFAVSDGTQASAPLCNQAYLPDRLEAQLDDNARRFFARPENLRADLAARELWIAPLAATYQHERGLSQQAAIAALSPYFPDDAARRLASSADVDIRYLARMDASNEQAARKD